MILPERNAFSQLIHPPLGRRSAKTRETGLTMVIDKGLGLQGLRDLLETAGSYVDILKLGFGTSLLYPGNTLRQKLALARLYAVTTCTGGTLAEIAMTQGAFESLVDQIISEGFTAVEISDGTITVDPAIRQSAIRYVANQNLTVISEVGKKLTGWPSAKCMAKQIQQDLDDGASLVIVEGRECGENVGIYGSGGVVDESLLGELVQHLSSDALSKILWESPKKSQQIALIQHFGQNVNLGNIQPDEVMALESLRLGYRSDTFAWTL